MKPTLRRLTLATAVALTITRTACGTPASTDNGVPAVDPALTTATALNNLVTYMTDTLGALNPATSLARANPVAGADSLSDGNNVPCNDNDQTGRGPVNFQFSLFVHDLPANGGPAALDAIEATWSAKGWAPQRDSRGSTQTIRAVARGGYALSAVLNNRGTVALSGSSPCYPYANADIKASAPRAIPHPA